MKVTEVKSFSNYDYKEKKYRGFELVLDDEKLVKRSILESEPMIMVGDEFPETDYEIVEAKDKNGNSDLDAFGMPRLINVDEAKLILKSLILKNRL